MVLNLFIDKFISIYNKEGFDFDAPVIKLHNFHPQLRLVLAINGQFFNNKESLLRFVWPFICVGMGFVAVTLELITLSHAVTTNDFLLFTECFAYCVIMGVVPVLYTCTFKGSEKIFKILDSMSYDFINICSLGEPYRSTFLKGQLMIWQFGILWVSFITLVVMMYLSMSIGAIINYSLFVTQDEHSVRPLIFPLWIPTDDVTRTPNFEILLFCEYLVIFIFVLTFVVYVYILFHILLHAYIQIDIVITGIGLIFEDVDEKSWKSRRLSRNKKWREIRLEFNNRFKRIVSWHNTIFDTIQLTEEIYGPVMVYQVMLSSIALCLMCYQVAEQLDQGKFDILFTLLCVGTLMQLWIPCYIGSLIRTKGLEVADAAFVCGWHESPFGTMVGSDIRLLIARANKPITFQVTAIPPLNLETFSSIISTTYTYFNMLRQTDSL